jgi:uncharacterized SAM-binding protein YcdF (DUF218 family)
MHVLFKLAFLAAKPSTLIVLALAAGVALLWHPRRIKLGRKLVLAGVAGLLIAGYSPLGNVLTIPLEGRFPRPDALPHDVAGIILLGGFEEGTVGPPPASLLLTDAAERLTESLLLARRLPSAKVIFAGGDGSILGAGSGFSSAVGDFLEEAGVARDRIILEGRSRNTFENAVFTRDLLQPKPGQHWLLVTSASHMPRAVGTFRQAGLDVIPWPVDYRASPNGYFKPFESLTVGLERTEGSLREWMGLAAYRVLGRTGELWPGPKPSPPS